MESLATRLDDPRPLLLDGAMGSLLEARGLRCDPPLWSARPMREHPEEVARIHREYAAAGAELLTTNTFRTRARNFAAGGWDGDAGALARRAAAVARDAARAETQSAGRGVWVAGSIAPLEDCYEPGRTPDDASLAAEHGALARDLCDAGCDLLLVETHNSAREALAATLAAAATGLPVWSTVVCGPDARLLSGEPLADLLPRLADAGATAVGVNCVALEHGPAALGVLSASGLPFGFAPNLHFDPSRGALPDRSTTPEELVTEVAPWVRAGARFVGACCGSEPRHIAQLRAALLPAPKRASR